MKATLATPLTWLPAAGLVWVEGSALTAVVTTPAGLILEIRPPRTALWVLPVYGPTENHSEHSDEWRRQEPSHFAPP
jgi:hypothetical protein